VNGESALSIAEGVCREIGLLDWRSPCSVKGRARHGLVATAMRCYTGSRAGLVRQWRAARSRQKSKGPLAHVSAALPDVVSL
jgi:hypothetical protein